MTGPEHYRIAVDMLEGADEFGLKVSELIAVAQVHATLALAAATVSALHAGGPFAGLAAAEWTEVLKP